MYTIARCTSLLQSITSNNVLSFRTLVPKCNSNSLFIACSTILPVSASVKIPKTSNSKQQNQRITYIPCPTGRMSTARSAVTGARTPSSAGSAASEAAEAYDV